jgi:hypothetical protein
MAVRDILLTLTSYPDPTPVSVIDRAVSLATALDAHLAAISCEVHIQVPGSLISFRAASGIAAGEAHRSHDSAQALLAAFEASAQKAGVLHEIIHEKSLSHRVSERLVEYARLHDLTIVSVPESYDQWYAEAIIFGSGRPTLVLPESQPFGPFELNTVVVAWDFGPFGRKGSCRRHPDAGEGKESARGHRDQRDGHRHQALVRGTRQEPGATRNRCHL